MVLQTILAAVVPGAIILLCLPKVLKDLDLLSFALVSTAFGLGAISTIGYILDLTIGVSWVSYFVFTYTLLFFVALLRKTQFRTSLGLLRESRIPWRIVMVALPILAFLSYLVLIGPYQNDYLYPSDPVVWLFTGRYTAVIGHWALPTRIVSQGYAMTQSFGFDYLLGILFSFDLKQSFTIIRFLGPIFGVVALLSVYKIVSRLSGSSVGALTAMIVYGTSYLLVWAQRLSTEYTIIAFALPLAFLLLYEFLMNRSSEHLFSLGFIIATIWLFHPPSALLFLVPIVVISLARRRFILTLRESIKITLVFFTFTAPYWLLLNGNSLSERLNGIADLNMGSQLYLPSLDHYLLPLSYSGFFYGIIPITVLALSVILLLRTDKLNFASRTVLLALLTLLLLETLYWVFPVPLQEFLSHIYDVSRMPLHIALPVSILLGSGVAIVFSKLREGLSMIHRHRGHLFYPKLIAGLLIVIVIPASQLAWGYQNLGQYQSLYRGAITDDGVRVIEWLQDNVPLNSTILFDSNTTSDYQTLLSLGTYGYISHAGSIETRGDGWLAYASLFPRLVIGDSSFFNQIEGSLNWTAFESLCAGFGVDYIVMTNPELSPVLALSLGDSLVHTEGGIEVFRYANVTKTGLVLDVAAGPNGIVSSIATSYSYFMSTDVNVTLRLTGSQQYYVGHYPSSWQFYSVSGNSTNLGIEDNGSSIAIVGANPTDSVMVVWKTVELGGTSIDVDSLWRGLSPSSPPAYSDGYSLLMNKTNNSTGTIWYRWDFNLNYSFENSSNPYLVIVGSVLEQNPADYVTFYLNNVRGPELDNATIGSTIYLTFPIRKYLVGPLSLENTSVELRVGAGSSQAFRLSEVVIIP